MKVSIILLKGERFFNHTIYSKETSSTLLYLPVTLLCMKNAEIWGTTIPYCSVFRNFHQVENFKQATLPKTSSKSCENKPSQKGNFIFQAPLFRGFAVSFRGIPVYPLPFWGHFGLFFQVFLLLLLNSRGCRNLRIRAVLLVSLVSPPHTAAKEHLKLTAEFHKGLGVFGGIWFLV